MAIIGSSLAGRFTARENSDRQDADARQRNLHGRWAAANRRGGFFGENHQDNQLNLPVHTIRRRFGEPDRLVLYMRAQPGGQREECFRQSRTILPAVAWLPPGADNDFTLSTADSDHRDLRLPSARASAWRPWGWQR